MTYRDLAETASELTQTWIAFDDVDTETAADYSDEEDTCEYVEVCIVCVRVRVCVRECECVALSPFDRDNTSTHDDEQCPPSPLLPAG